MWKGQKYFLLFFILFNVSNSYSQVFKTISIEFNRIVKEKDSEDNVKGHIYYDLNKSIIITEKPINQWMILENNVLLIYYPDDRQAIRIKSQNPVSMPFSQFLYGLFDNNLGLIKLGYTISKNELHHDTLSVHWKPPKDMEKKVGEFVIALKEKKIISTEMKDTDRKTIIYTRYDNHIEYCKQFFPLKITSNISSESGPTTEIILFDKPVFNKPLPENILNFKLPDNLIVKEVEW